MLRKFRVLIESDWNLKYSTEILSGVTSDVLIESDWNLKQHNGDSVFRLHFVLIESDWNLKDLTTENDITPAWGINRIRLEFKEAYKLQ